MSRRAENPLPIHSLYDSPLVSVCDCGKEVLVCRDDCAKKASPDQYAGDAK